MTMAGLAAVFWGSMGVAGQYLLQNCHFTPMDLISIRMLLAGSIFVGIEFFLLKRGALKVFETKQNIIDLIIYTLTIIGTQLTFFVCIQYANAPFAAVLTATVPLWIIVNFQRFPTLDAKKLVNAPKMSAHHRGICHF